MAFRLDNLLCLFGSFGTGVKDMFVLGRCLCIYVHDVVIFFSLRHEQ